MSRGAREFGWLGLGLLCLGAFSGCSRPPPPRYPGQLRPMSDALPELALRQQIRGRLGDAEFVVEAVLERRGDALRILGLTPFGTRAFLIEQLGSEWRLETFTDEPLPFPARFILLDVHRALFLGLEGAPLSDGEHRQEARGERVVERWLEGRLQERRFERLDDATAGTIRITYEGGWAPGSPPPPLRLENGWLGYGLEIVPL
ncbi:MAG: DUF3261 domain-containing protein [Myxococcales bacterium]|nr:DUF3261 domain-containing protein [Myxococcales bacterium]